MSQATVEGVKVKGEAPKLGAAFSNDGLAQYIDPAKLIDALRHHGYRYQPTDPMAFFARQQLVNDIKAFVAKSMADKGKDITKDPEAIEVANAIFDTGLIASDNGFYVAQCFGAIDPQRLMQIQQQIFMQQGYFPGMGGFPGMGMGMPGYMPMNGGFGQNMWQNNGQKQDNKQQAQPNGFCGPMGYPMGMMGGFPGMSPMGGFPGMGMGGFPGMGMMGGFGGGSSWQQYAPSNKAAANA